MTLTPASLLQRAVRVLPFSLPSSSARLPTSARPDAWGNLTTSRYGGHQRKPSLQDLTPSHNTLLFVVGCLAWYMSSALSSNLAKALMSFSAHEKSLPASERPAVPPFPYPVTLTLIHFLFVNALCAVCASQRILGRRAISRLVKPNVARIREVGQLSIFNVAGHALSSLAISRVPVSTVHTIKALSPLFTVLSYSLLFNVSYSMRTYTSLLPLTLGVMMACTGFHFNADDMVGFSSALGSTFIFVAQNIYSKKLLRKADTDNGSQEKMDKINILFYSSGCSVVLMLPMALYCDAGSMISSPSWAAAMSADGMTSRGLTVLNLLWWNGIVHFLQNILAFNVLSLVSPVTYSIASLLKRVFVIVIAIIWFHQSVSLLQWMGIFLTFFGLWMYNDSKTKEEVHKGEKAARKRDENAQQAILPTTIRGGGGAATSSAFPRTVSNIVHHTQHYPAHTDGYHYADKSYIRDPTRSLPSPPYSDKE